jgi:O-antigen ligase
MRNTLRIIVLLALAGGSAYLANQAIQVAAERGLFEQDLAQKFQTQSQGKLGVLFGGRPETLVAIQAIRDSPIIGHGSFAVDQRYIELKQDIQYEYGYSDTDTPEDVYPTIPTHSHLTMAWVESGILGGALWIYILVLVIRAILRISLLRPNLAPLYCYFLVNFVWDVLYSPFGSVNRIWAAYAILMSYGLLRERAVLPLPAATQEHKHLYPRRIIIRRYLAS